MTLIWIMLSLSSSSRIKSRNFGSYIINSVPSWTWTLSTLKCVMLFSAIQMNQRFLPLTNEEYGQKIYFVHFFVKSKLGHSTCFPHNVVTLFLDVIKTFSHLDEKKKVWFLLQFVFTRFSHERFWVGFLPSIFFCLPFYSLRSQSCQP